jgi:hypothetical protein
MLAVGKAIADFAVLCGFFGHGSRKASVAKSWTLSIAHRAAVKTVASFDM